jgi:hypothetical protein
MLINRIKQSYRDLTRHTEPVQPIVTVAVTRSAANASDFNEPETQARRLRRQSRMNGAGHHGGAGWRVRAW